MKVNGSFTDFIRNIGMDKNCTYEPVQFYSEMCFYKVYLLQNTVNIP
jgi:hypothetical protein